MEWLFTEKGPGFPRTLDMGNRARTLRKRAWDHCEFGGSEPIYEDIPSTFPANGKNACRARFATDCVAHQTVSPEIEISPTGEQCAKKGAVLRDFGGGPRSGCVRARRMSWISGPFSSQISVRKDLTASPAAVRQAANPSSRSCALQQIGRSASSSCLRFKRAGWRPSMIASTMRGLSHESRSSLPS